jgi:hypothetical protein
MFLNRTHRVNLSLEDEELKHLQFYISTDVLVQYGGPSGKQSLFLPDETPGVVTTVGPDWLKVSFLCVAVVSRTVLLSRPVAAVR